VDLAKLSKQAKQRRVERNPEVSLNMQLDGIVTKVMQMDESGVFLHPVPENKYPHYRSVVPNPMDLGTVRERTRAHGYHSTHEFLGDIRLMVSNCERFNGQEHGLSTVARRLLENAEQLVEKNAELHTIEARLAQSS
jgi:hypothetical protein